MMNGQIYLCRSLHHVVSKDLPDQLPDGWQRVYPVQVIPLSCHRRADAETKLEP